MPSLLPPDDRAWAARALGGGVVSARRLKGGISAHTLLVVAERPDGSRERAVLRRLSDDWIAAEPGIVAREAALLEEPERRSVPAPKHLAHDPNGPLLMTFERGHPIHLPKDSARFTERLVDALVHIHAGGPPRGAGYRDQATRLDAHVQDESPWRNGVAVDPALWSHVRRLWPSVERRPPTLIHDDYHPGTVLWHRRHLRRRRLDGPGNRPAGCRRVLPASRRLTCSRTGAGDAVLATYESAMGEPVPDRPFWDLLSATRAVGIAEAWFDSWVDFGVPGVTLPLVEERLDAFVARALAEI